MPTILNIETSTSVCSVALTNDGFILYHREDFKGLQHASVLSGYIYDTFKYIEEHENTQLDAIAVSLGPGSYTGLRIGLSEAKGLAYGLKKPLIGIGTLDILAVEAMFKIEDFDPETDIIIPMLDARRNEVYAEIVDGYLNVIREPFAEVICDNNMIKPFLNKRIVFVGNGAYKMEEYTSGFSNVVYLKDSHPLATSMCALSEKNYMDKKFIDVAYSTPIYIKDFQATKPKNKLY